MTIDTEPAPITDVASWLEATGERRALQALGELLLGVTAVGTSETADRFTARCLNVPGVSHLAVEERPLDPVARVTVPLALSEWMQQHGGAIEVGPFRHSEPPQWTQTEVGDTTYRHPKRLRVFFPAGTLLDGKGVVLGVENRDSTLDDAQITASVAPEHRAAVQPLLDRLFTRAEQLNPYRGKAIRATYVRGGLRLTVIDLPAITRETVIVPPEVWQEVDLGVTAVRDRHQLLNVHGLGTRRGILLVGPPGTGKSAVSAVIAGEVLGEFTVIYVEARAGAELLTAVVEQAQKLGGPVLLVLEDVDLWCRDRARGSSGLSELLQAMDIASDARILTLASTNDAATLDRAAVRTGRFDSIVEVGHPDRDAATAILTALVSGLPGGTGVDCDTVAGALPAETTGSDLREIVRRAVLTAGDTGQVTTNGLLAEVRGGRYQAQLPAGAGAYL
ncbi:AAA family ATPase [Tsukamurella soli]|uniref:AAA+ ATPase domain-containing protein n=1 Tax=Tsukamurella soli TaxID=644556 RepID=A0ABP8JPT0_9ACTN